MPGTVFISYHHSDQSWKDRLVTQLATLEGEGILRAWHDGLIQPGVDWLSEIEAAMAEARVALLLVSAPFLASEFIRRQEVPVLIERSKAAGVHVIPLIVRSCLWKQVDWLSALQARPRMDHTLSDLSRARAEKELAKLAEEISELLQADGASGAAAQRGTSRRSRSPSAPVEPDRGRVQQGGRTATSDPPEAAVARSESLQSTPTPAPWGKSWKAWAYLAIAAGLALVLSLLFKPHQEIPRSELPATGERITFLPGPQVEQPVKDQIVADLASFAGYLKGLGYRPPGTEVNISFQPQPPLQFNYDPWSHTIYIYPPFAKDTDVARHEYTHRMLLAATQQTSFDHLSDTYSAMESGLAYYYPCSFRSHSDFGVIVGRENPQLWRPLNLLNHRSFEMASNDLSARETWASAFWDVRELLHQERADRLLLLAWSQLSLADLGGADPTRLVRLMTQDLEHDDPSSQGAARELQAIFARRGLAL
jgi:TIR domain